MNRLLAPLYPAAFLAGLAAIVWAGFSALQHHPLALGMTGLIAGFYLLGGWELQRFRLASQQLAAQLNRRLDVEQGLAPWLQPAPSWLQELLQQRLNGQRALLPGLSLAPALAALLVLLGMLGTFIGLVLTLGGTAAALSATADLAAMRAALTAPVKGLGLAFGTSVAGVAASAMLGLMIALVRRERAGTLQRLEQLLATGLRPYTAAHRKELAEQVQAQAQAQALPALVTQLQTFAAQLANSQAQFQQQFQSQWLAEQTRFHGETRAVYADLASAVQHSLQTALVDGAAKAGALLQPVAEQTMAGIAREAAALHQQVAAQSAAQLQATQAQQEAQGQRLGQQAEQLLQRLGDAQRAQFQAANDTDAARLAAWRSGLADSASQLQQQLAERSKAQMAEQLAEQRALASAMADTASAVLAQAQAQSQALLGDVGGLLRAAAETPRAAAEMAAALREQLSKSLAQDNALLAERNEQAARLQALLAGAEQSAAAQRSSIEALQQAAATQLQTTGLQFGEQLQQLAQQFAHSTEASGAQLRDTATLLAASSAEIGALGEGFSTAVEQFHGSNEKLMAHLAQIDSALAQAGTRSEEQLAYTVAQARELIDLCLMAQKQALDALRLAAPEAAHG